MAFTTDHATQGLSGLDLKLCALAFDPTELAHYTKRTASSSAANEVATRTRL